MTEPVEACCKRWSQGKFEAFASQSIGARVDAAVRLQERRALAVVEMSPSSYRCEARKRDVAALKLRIKEISLARVHYGYRRVSTNARVSISWICRVTTARFGCSSPAAVKKLHS